MCNLWYEAENDTEIQQKTETISYIMEDALEIRAQLIISRERRWMESLINFLNREARALLFNTASSFNTAVFKIVWLQLPVAIRCSSRGES